MKKPASDALVCPCGIVHHLACLRPKYVRSLRQYIKNVRYVLVPFRGSDGRLHMRTWAWRFLLGHANTGGGL